MILCVMQLYEISLALHFETIVNVLLNFHDLLLNNETIVNTQECSSVETEDTCNTILIIL